MTSVLAPKRLRPACEHRHHLLVRDQEGYQQGHPAQCHDDVGEGAHFVEEYPYQKPHEHGDRTAGGQAYVHGADGGKKTRKGPGALPF